MIYLNYIINSTIFTTENNKLSIFGKTLDSIKEKIVNFNNVTTQNDLLTNTVKQLIPEEKLTKILSTEDASIIVSNLNSIKDGTNQSYKSFDEYFNFLNKESQGYITDYVKANQNQIYITDDVIEASKKAREAQIAQNEAIKSSTISAKAGQAALKGLAIAGNIAISMIASYAISKAINAAAKAWDNYSKSQENAIERGNEALSKMKENQEKIKSAQSLLDDIKSNTVMLDGGVEITRFEQLSQGVNILGENISLTSDEFEEYNSLLDEMTNAGLTATNSMASLEKQVAKLRETTNNDTLKGLGDWIDSFNAQNNQVVTDFTKEVGWQQQIDALTKIYDDPNVLGDQVEKVTMHTGLDRVVDTFKRAGELLKATSELEVNAYDNVSEQYIKSADKIKENSDELTTITESIKEFAEEYNIDIYDEKGNFDYKKYSSNEVQTQIGDAIENIKSSVESAVKESSGFLKALFENNSEFDSISAEATTAIERIFDNIDYDTISTYMMDSNGMLSQQKMREWVRNISEKVTDSGVQDELNKLFELDTQKSKMTFDEYQKQANDLIKSISNSVPELSKSLLSKTSGINDTIESLQKSYDEVAKMFGKKNANRLSNSKLQLAAEIIAKDNFSGTFDELLGRIALTKEKAIDLNSNLHFNAIAEADETVNSGADYEKALTYYKEAKEMLEKGLVGTDDFKTRAAYFSPTGSDDPVNFEENMGRAARYLTEDSTGVQNFLNDLQKKGYATFTTLSDGTKKWTYNIEDLDGAASNMNMSFEWFMDMFGRLEDYGFHNNFVSSLEGGADRIRSLSSELVEAESKLAELKSTGADTTAIEQQEVKVNQLKQDLIETQENMNKLVVHSADDYAKQVETAKTTIKTLKEERDKILKDNTYGENTENVVALMDAQIREWASENEIELDANLNIINTEEIQNTPISLKGTVDLTERPTVSGKTMREAGWSEVEDNETATVYSSAYSNEKGDKTVLVTPILPNGEVLSPEKLSEYASQLLAGQTIEPNISIRTFNGEDSIQQSELYAEALHRVQEAYYLGDETQKKSVESLKNYSYEQLQAIDLMDDSTSNAEDSLVSLMDQFGLSSEYVEQFINVLSDMNLINQPLSDIDLSNVDELISKANESKDIIQELIDKTDNPINLNFESANVGDINSQIDSVKKVLVGLQDENGVVSVETEGVQECLDALKALNVQKSQLSGEVLMSVDTSQLDGDLQTVLSKLQEFHEAYGELQTLKDLQSVGVNVDTSQAEEKLNSITTELQGLTGSQAEILATVIPDPSSAEKIEEGIGTISVTALVDDLKLPENAITNPQLKASVFGKKDVDDLVLAIEKVQNKSVSVKASTKGKNAVDQLVESIKSVKSKTVTITTKKKEITETEANGTITPALASGTAYNVLNAKLLSAYFGGRVDLPQDEVALVNELGTEGLIRDGKLMAIPGGMHMQALRKGDIILSVEQMKALYATGKAPGHARAYASGSISAYAGSSVGSGGGSFYTSKSSSSSKTSTSNTNTSKDDSTSSDTEDKFEETLDLVKIYLERQERRTEKLVNAIDDAVGLVDKQAATNKAISQVQAEIQANQKAYNTYKQKADAVDLSSDYKNKIINGQLSIETITDESLNDSIQEFQQWYDEMLACEDKIDDLKDKLKDLAQTKFDNVTTEFENQISLIEHETKMLESTIDLIESQGYIVTRDYYDNLIKQEEENYNKLQSEYKTLTDTLNDLLDQKLIEKYSDQWYDMTNSINEVSEAILDSQKALVEYENAIRDLEWDFFDKTQDMLSQIQAESDFLVELMSNDKMYDSETGKITEKGQATLGLHAVNYNAYMSQADDYAKEIAKIDKELADDPNNQTLLERRQELLETQRDMIKSAEDEKQAIKDLVSDGYDVFLEVMQKTIDKRKELLTNIKDLYDYEKNIAEQTKEISSLEKQLNAYQGDTSEEAKSTIQQLKVSLEEAKKNLEETEYDKYISDQEQLLDNLYDQTQEFFNARLDNLELIIQNVIDSTNENSESIKETLTNEAESVGATLSDAMNAIWSPDGTYTSVVTTYGDNFSSLLTTTNSTLATIRKYVAKMAGITESEENTSKPSTPKPSTPNTDNSSNNSTNNNTSSSSSGKWGSWFISKKDSYPKNKLDKDKSIVDRLRYFDYDFSMSARAKYYKAMGKTDTYTGSAAQNQWMLSEMKKNGFKKGGTIGSLIKRTGEDGYVLARTGEEILSLDKIDALKDTFITMDSMFKSLVKLPEIPQSQVNNGNVTNEITFHFELPNVRNADDFVNALQNDKRCEKIIQQMTLGAMTGKNSLLKYNY